MTAINYKILEDYGLHETAEILRNGDLQLHPAVLRVTLDGSRGLKGGYQEDSDVDLGLVLDNPEQITYSFCEEVLLHTLNSWKGKVGLDLAVIFDKSGCGLKCLNYTSQQIDICDRGVDCIGLFRLQKGYTGFIDDIGLEIKYAYPCLIIYDRSIK